MSTAQVASSGTVPAVTRNWLWNRRDDFVFNLLPLWLGLLAAWALYAIRDLGNGGSAPWDFPLAGYQVRLGALFLYLYSPLVDAPHLWATIARTYVDRDEWKTRRKLFLGSLSWLLFGPVLILLPYGLHALNLVPERMSSWGWVAFSEFLTFYALFHINRQHWGFVALYRRKNGEPMTGPERDVDSWFFHLAVWLPTISMLAAPWYLDFDGKPFPWMQGAAGGAIHTSLQLLFAIVCASYAAFQVLQWRRGVPRNLPKLAYLATVVGLYFVTFSLSPAIATFWVPLIGVGHCAQYHRIVWAYGSSRYAKQKTAPGALFDKVWLYALFGVIFGVVTLQGFGSGRLMLAVAQLLDANHAFAFLTAGAGVALGVKVLGAMISGVRLHHFYVDSKIWRVSKSASLARNLTV